MRRDLIRIRRCRDGLRNNFQEHATKTFANHAELLGRFLADVDVGAAVGNAAVGDTKRDAVPCRCMLNFRCRPKFSKRARPRPIDYAFARGATHFTPSIRIDYQLSDCASEIFDIVGFRDQTVPLVLDQFFRSAGIGHDYRNARCLRFDNHVAERIRCARENEDVG